MKSDWSHIATLSGDALTAEFTRLITEASKTLPMVGKLRHRSKLVATEKDGAPLAKAREAALKIGAATSCVDNAAAHERVFALFHLGLTKKDKTPLLAESVYDSLTYAQARTLSEAAAIMRENIDAHNVVQKYLGGTVCKFADGWADHVLKIAKKAANIVDAPAPVVTPEASTPAPTDTPAPETAPPSNVTLLPAPSPCKSAPDATARIMDTLRAACAELNAKQLETVRASLARACNSPDAFAKALAPVELADAA